MAMGLARAVLTLVGMVAVTGCHPVVGEGETEAGTVRLLVLDAGGRGIAGVSVRFEVPREPELLKVTDSSGRAEAHGTQGVWQATMTPPPGYSVPQTQSNPFSFRVRRLQTTEVTARLSQNTP